MAPTSISILAIGMSVDALIAALGRGAARRHSIIAAVGAGAIFGVVETITPLIGWMLGLVASSYVQAIDHWIAFSLLGAIGIKMVLDSMNPKKELAQNRSPWVLVATAIGTSIDAMAVGVSLAFLQVNIIVVATAIGLATTVMATVGILAGRIVSAQMGRVAGLLGGIALIGLGLSILVEHLGVS